MADDTNDGLVPFDPWGASGVAPPAEGTTDVGGALADKFYRYKAQQGLDAATLPHDVATGAGDVAPTTPGMWSDEDEARLQLNKATIGKRAGDLSKAAITGGMPMAASGALGSAGGKLITPAAEEAPVPAFHSAVEKAVSDSKLKAAPAAQWAGTIKNSPGVKPEEMDWLGLEDFLANKKGPVSKQELLDHIGGNKVELQEVMHAQRDPSIDRVQDPKTKFGDYTLPGGENYRELLLTLPGKARAPAEMGREYYENFVRRGGQPSWDELSPAMQREWTKSAQQVAPPTENNFRGSHWDEPNVLAHVRFDDRVIGGPTPERLGDIQKRTAEAVGAPVEHLGSGAADAAVRKGAINAREAADLSRHLGWQNQFMNQPGVGDKTLHLAEIQSDWHQAGRKQGYQGKLTPEQQALAAERDKLSGEVADFGHPPPYDNPEVARRMDRITAINNQIGSPGGNVPNAPFKNTWHELALKRMIRHAADNGYDRISWDTGATNADRYDLSTHLDRIEHAKEGDKYRVRAYSKDDPQTTFGGEGQLPQLFDSPQEIEKQYGKEIAEKIANGEGTEPERKTRFNAGMKTLRGGDLRVGAEGMRGFYDKMLPAAANKLGKKYGARAERSSINTGSGWMDGTKAMETMYGKPGYEDMPKPHHKEASHMWFKRLSHADREKLFEDARKASSADIHSMEITPELKKAAQTQGFPLFADGGAVAQRAEGGPLDDPGYDFVPVDHDPFAAAGVEPPAEGTTDTLGSAVADKLGNLSMPPRMAPIAHAIAHTAKGMYELGKTPRELMEQIEPERPGFLSEEDVARQRMADERLQNKAHEGALALFGTGAPAVAAEEGTTLGAFGGAGGRGAKKPHVNNVTEHGVEGGQLAPRNAQAAVAQAPEGGETAQALGVKPEGVALAKEGEGGAKEVGAKAVDAAKAFKEVTGRDYGSAPTDLKPLGRGDVVFPPGKSLETFEKDVADKIKDVKEWNTPDRRYWYENSGKSILTSVGGDPEMADRLTAAVSKTSQGTPVLDNAAYAARGHAQAMVGEPVVTGRYPNEMGKHITGFYNDPEAGVIGPKITGYQSGFRSAWAPVLNEGANDIHNMRWLGFKKGAGSDTAGPTTVNGEVFTGTPTTAQHNYDRLVRSAVTDKLNAEGFDGGKWAPGQVQAVGWAKTRAAGGVPEEEAGYDIRNAFNDRSARLTYESAPGKTTGHMPEYHDAPFETKNAYHEAINGVLTDPMGRDIVASHMGLLTMPTEHGIGVYQGAVSPGSAAKVVAGNAPGGWGAGIDPATRELMQATELTRGLLLRQDAVAYHFPAYPKNGLKWDKANTIDVRTGSPMTEAEARTVTEQLAKDTGSDFFSPIFTGNGYRFINVPEASGISNKAFRQALDKTLNKVYPDKAVEAVGGYSDSFYHANDWSKDNGTGYLEALRGLRPDVQRRAAEVLATLGPDVSRVENEFAARHGWTPNKDSRVWEANPAYGKYKSDFKEVTPGTPPKPWLRNATPFRRELLATLPKPQGRASGGRVGGKVTKSSVHYRNGSQDERCGNCDMYEENKCTLVLGFISPKKVCDRWEATKRAIGGPIDMDNLGADPRIEPSPTEEIEDFQEEQQERRGHPVDRPIGPDERGVDPVKGWPNSVRLTRRAHGGRVDRRAIDHAPTEDQKKAGNYAKDHLSFQGIPLAIENARGSYRNGVGKNGKTWAVCMPCHYGYVKRTTGADGDHLDIFLGPHKRAPNVFIIDQCDAESGKFDEHKAMLGFGSAAQAKAYYCKSFSDGRGAKRCHHITTMTVAQFKDWIQNYDTTKPLKRAA